MERDWLYHQYVTLGKSLRDIGNDISKSSKTISYWMKKFDIPRRQYAYQSEYRTNKNRVSVICDSCGKEFLKPPARANRREHQFCSTECGHQFIRDQLKSQNQSSRRKYSYTLWRNAVKERDGYMCQKCGSTEKLHVHHLLPYLEHKELREDIDNGITFCSKCHYEIHKIMRDEDMV